MRSLRFLVEIAGTVMLSLIETVRSLKITEVPVTREQLLQVVPPAYHKFLVAFSPTQAEKLPSHSKFDHSIDLEPGSLAPLLLLDISTTCLDLSFSS